MRTLIFGYGNADRQDDGVAWHILKELITRNNLAPVEDADIDIHDEIHNVDYGFQLQLTPEMADDLKKYDRVCFVDAHTGAVPEEIQVDQVTAIFQKSALTHHLTPASLLSITETIYHKVPQTILVSVRGYEFGFSQSLSAATASLTRQAADIIMNWMQKTT